GCVAIERLKTVGRVAVAGCVAKKRLKTVGRVVAAGCVVQQRKNTVGRVLLAGFVAIERSVTNGRVLVAAEGARATHVAIERIKTNGRVALAVRKALEGSMPLSCVTVGVASVRRRRRQLCLSRSPRRKQGQRERKEHDKKTTPQRGAVN